ncbi:hypothetical protein MADA3029_1010024 [Vibrio nigripulchritudo MADA3029]|uniref:Uncharacterized protein n=1 Tax=Vibrio nigripulchritudo TaxID=28173 RepID=U4K9T4_9VIBR|nr:hypothetical protein [Vibrio nigripulchritudo]CCN48945.1 hypothetical protein VIBNIMADA3020_660024 [Vibrio nigripulchritudo MADA3020]CCN53231.1 hypothetical protein VIBNIMADA3021_220024 [Vibrio nigripulchritudo MADA3021]CCN56833.1 hypothetical protein MADA3029_1010024 [Vibrio nigripulchritudo MADA3029]CCN85472.1 hypothetical protein VIBNIBLFn1_940009 [Vibrio nigripulchritudo BLFn1]CCN89059.1 hypothetical protein VIBNISFn27_550086 [Vibrio nigripulchritudo SFn27]
MTDLLPVISDLGLKPTELLILFMLWQNIKNTRNILDRLVEKVGKLELKLHSERSAGLKTHDRA